MKRSNFVAFLLAVCLVLPSASAPLTAAAAKPRVNNVIVLVPDGTGAAHTTVARWYKGHSLALDEMVSGSVRTYSAESLITDSAPAATAFATGNKSNSKYVGILPSKVSMPGLVQIADELKFKPVATVLEGAKLQGKATGIIATSNIQHATPAGYSSHTYNRGDYNDIAKQQVYENIDVVLGGGKQYLLPKGQGGKRTDQENLVNIIKSKGYTYVETRDELTNAQGTKLYGAFADDAMAYEFDRKVMRPSEPTLAEMTRKAIEILAKDKDGFFLFVEGSKVDWASHANDPIGVISDVLAFDDAVKAALDFAKRDGHTLVLAFSDHGNGGMSIGNKQTDKNYDTLGYEIVFSPLKKAILTGEGIEKMLDGNRTAERISEVVVKYYGVIDLTKDELAAIQAHKGELNYALGPILSRRSGIGWTTSGHTGEDLFLYAYGPNRPIGLYENSELAQVTAEALRVDLEKTNKQLFINAEEAFKAIGATTAIDKIDETNLKLVVKKNNVSAELPVSKNIILIDGKHKELKGVTIYEAKTQKVYVSQDAIDLVATAAK